MRLLLDTHVLLWWLEDAADLSRKAKAAISNPENECLVSVASCWELAIKLSIKKLRLPAPIDRFIPEQLALNQFQLLDIRFNHVARVATLPFHHRDPFDRMMISQVLEENLSIVTVDRVFSRYGVARIW